jgi:Na+-transporting NADH:ubiquinone oxidoreductase subunit F
MTVLKFSDYSLTGESSEQAIERGLASAAWYTTPIPREKMRELLTRRDGPAIRDTLLWFAILITLGILGYLLWGTWWAVIPFALYGVIYGSTSDSRWHESSHGTAFKTDWMNNVLYEISSFMVMRESTVTQWSHTRHHSDTIIVGRDPEIAVPRPPNIKTMILNLFLLVVGPRFFRLMAIHACGKLTADERTFIPQSEHHKVYFKARIYLLIYAVTIGLSIYLGSILPLMYIGLPNFYGAWLMSVYGSTQHAGLAENVLDHRLNCRTVYMNPINRYLYWNMNYHLEHHMFPLVPYHALPKLHELIKHEIMQHYFCKFFFLLN